MFHYFFKCGLKLPVNGMISYILDFSFQVEGKGNGIKTVIVNMVDVAKALNRPPTCKFYIIFH